MQLLKEAHPVFRPYRFGKGIAPMPEKLECIKDMPPPKTAKEVKQFLGLIGYYRKFVPRFSDLARPLNVLTRKDVPFEWTPVCQERLSHD